MFLCDLAIGLRISIYFLQKLFLQLDLLPISTAAPSIASLAEMNWSDFVAIDRVNSGSSFRACTSCLCWRRFSEVGISGEQSGRCDN